MPDETTNSVLQATFSKKYNHRNVIKNTIPNHRYSINQNIAIIFKGLTGMKFFKDIRKALIICPLQTSF